jgi:hypothetical protein
MLSQHSNLDSGLRKTIVLSIIGLKNPTFIGTRKKLSMPSFESNTSFFRHTKAEKLAEKPVVKEKN